MKKCGQWLKASGTSKYNKAVERQAKNRDTDPDKKTGINEQIADGEKKAAEYNKKNPTKNSSQNIDAEL